MQNLILKQMSKYLTFKRKYIVWEILLIHDEKYRPQIHSNYNTKTHPIKHM
jgi:hypothetical protein